MEQSDHIIMGQQGGLIALPFSKVAHQVGDRRLKQPVVRSAPTVSHAIHPCAASLALSGRGVQVELA